MPFFCSSCSGTTSRNPWIGLAAGVVGGLATLVATLGFAQPGGEEGSAPAQTESKEPATVLVRLETSKGNIDIELNQEKAPISVANFLEYVDKGHYDNTIFHRVIPNFMVQGGGFDKDMTQKPAGKGIENEWKNGLKNVRGSLAMARLGNQPNSATAQFFINVADNSFLDTPRDGAGYAVFGKVVQGMDVVDAIVAVPTTNKGPHQNVPVDPVIIKKASRLAEKNDG